MRYSTDYIALFQGTCRELEKTALRFPTLGLSRKVVNPFLGQSSAIKDDIGQLAKKYKVDATADQVLQGRGWGSRLKSQFFEDNPEQVLNQFLSRQVRAKAQGPGKEKVFASLPGVAAGTALGVGGLLGGEKLYENYTNTQAQSQEQALRSLAPEDMDMLNQYYGGDQ